MPIPAPSAQRDKRQEKRIKNTDRASLQGTFKCMANGRGIWRLNLRDSPVKKVEMRLRSPSVFSKRPSSAGILCQRFFLLIEP